MTRIACVPWIPCWWIWQVPGRCSVMNRFCFFPAPHFCPPPTEGCTPPQRIAAQLRLESSAIVITQPLQTGNNFPLSPVSTSLRSIDTRPENKSLMFDILFSAKQRFLPSGQSEQWSSPRGGFHYPPGSVDLQKPLPWRPWVFWLWTPHRTQQTYESVPMSHNNYNWYSVIWVEL